MFVQQMHYCVRSVSHDEQTRTTVHPTTLQRAKVPDISGRIEVRRWAGGHRGRTSATRLCYAMCGCSVEAHSCNSCPRPHCGLGTVQSTDTDSRQASGEDRVVQAAGE